MAITSLVDIARLTVYGSPFRQLSLRGHGRLLAAGTCAAFGGAYLGNRLLKKVTLRGLQKVVAFALLVIAAGQGAGLL